MIIGNILGVEKAIICGGAEYLLELPIGTVVSNGFQNALILLHVLLDDLLASLFWPEYREPESDVVHLLLSDSIDFFIYHFAINWVENGLVASEET